MSQGLVLQAKQCLSSTEYSVAQSYLSIDDQVMVVLDKVILGCSSHHLHDLRAPLGLQKIIATTKWILTMLMISDHAPCCGLVFEAARFARIGNVAVKLLAASEDQKRIFAMMSAIMCRSQPKFKLRKSYHCFAG
ncbi:MAG: hypothetical protein J0I79_12445 [Mesorhizobium sp.]|uniref:hypothetical protein n=1 Tax=Mesorhizobium sp. TaxID=1871066 RepID=UPI001AD20792|nr:hypothetical protein [Mesorhizobium sp.]MBN9218755.1 hypothetical protein [Mesorhizobium sp.]